VNATDKQNPFYGAFGLTPAGALATTDNTANNYFLKFIEVSQENDPRLDQFYQAPIAATDFGALNGSVSGTVVTGTGFGPGLLGDPATGATRDQFIMPAFESLFFQAEAIARGWLPGDAKDAYTNAVQEDFRWLNVTTTTSTLSGVAITDSISNYYLTNNSTPWPSDKTAQINLIAFQKYISLCGIDPLESWSDLRRGVLILPAGYLSNNKNRAASLPNVLTYPQSEFTTNHVNIPTTPALRTTATIFTEKLFWQP
jgi:hypothetical protein